MMKEKDDVVILTTDHSKLEEKFEATGQKIGKVTGKVVSKSLDGIEKTKVKLKENETINQAKIKTKSHFNKAKEHLKNINKKDRS